jgi:ribonuclease HII
MRLPVNAGDSGLPFPDGPLERDLCAQGLVPVCGVDEAGRGPLAGPVVAAAVLFRDCETIWRARDSKAICKAARDEYYSGVIHDLEFAVGVCSPEEIDELNILGASLTAMERAVAALPEEPAMILVDGLHRLRLAIPSRAIVKGDARVALIGAASIIAKVTRDRMMREYDREYPAYGFARHFGYPTAEHRRLLKEFGPCPIHRKSFHGVREYYQTDSSPATTANRREDQTDR